MPTMPDDRVVAAIREVLKTNHSVPFPGGYGVCATDVSAICPQWLPAIPAPMRALLLLAVLGNERGIDKEGEEIDADVLGDLTEYFERPSLPEDLRKIPPHQRWNVALQAFALLATAGKPDKEVDRWISELEDRLPDRLIRVLAAEDRWNHGVEVLKEHLYAKKEWKQHWKEQSRWLREENQMGPESKAWKTFFKPAIEINANKHAERSFRALLRAEDDLVPFVALELRNLWPHNAARTEGSVEEKARKHLKDLANRQVEERWATTNFVAAAHAWVRERGRQVHPTDTPTRLQWACQSLLEDPDAGQMRIAAKRSAATLIDALAGLSAVDPPDAAAIQADRWAKSARAQALGLKPRGHSNDEASDATPNEGVDDRSGAVVGFQPLGGENQIWSTRQREAVVKLATGDHAWTLAVRYFLRCLHGAFAIEPGTPHSASTSGFYAGVAELVKALEASAPAYRLNPPLSSGRLGIRLEQTTRFRAEAPVQLESGDGDLPACFCYDGHLPAVHEATLAECDRTTQLDALVRQALKEDLEHARAMAVLAVDIFRDPVRSVQFIPYPPPYTTGMQDGQSIHVLAIPPRAGACTGVLGRLRSLVRDSKSKNAAKRKKREEQEQHGVTSHRVVQAPGPAVLQQWRQQDQYLDAFERGKIFEAIRAGFEGARDQLVHNPDCPLCPTPQARPGVKESQ